MSVINMDKSYLPIKTLVGSFMLEGFLLEACGVGNGETLREFEGKEVVVRDFLPFVEAYGWLLLSKAVFKCLRYMLIPMLSK